MRSTNKEVIVKIHAHIMKQFETVQELKEQLDYMKFDHELTVYKTAYRLPEGGTFLIYNGDIQDTLKDWLQSEKTYDDYDAFTMYCHLIAREIDKICRTNKYITE